ncbi:MAG: ester cyclase [Acidimicrobiales bacterium]
MPTVDTTLVVSYLKAALEAGRTGDFTVTYELESGDVAFHDPGPSASSSRSAHQRRWQELVGAFTDLAFDLHDVMEAGDRVIARWSMRGTHGGEFAGVAPTGREIALAGISIYRLADGKIAEAWSSYDELGMLGQLGAAVEGEDGDDDDLDPEADFGMIV